jgi:hypothetical protein
MGFTPTDGTKFAGGIMPNHLFFVGENNFISVSGPGTLYLGANDTYAADNTGSVTMRVTFTKE